MQAPDNDASPGAPEPADPAGEPAPVPHRPPGEGAGGVRAKRPFDQEPEPRHVRRCAACRDELAEGGPRVTCAECALLYHPECAEDLGHCKRDMCANRRPSHPRWTRESRHKEQGLWLHLPSPPVPRQLKLITTLLVPPVAALGANPCMVFVIAIPLMEAFPDVPRWAIVAAAVAFVTVPCLALCLVMWQQYLQYRPALLDEKGVLLGHTSKWSGSRVRWEQIQGYKVRPRGVELVLQGRPWTRWFLAPLLRCEERQQHEVVVLLEARGVLGAEG